MALLIETVRNEIGACLECSYDKISVKEAQKRLNFSNEKDTTTFGKRRNWIMGADGIYTFATKTDKPKEPLPSVELAEQAIFYARELEMIVWFTNKVEVFFPLNFTRATYDVHSMMIYVIFIRVFSWN